MTAQASLDLAQYVAHMMSARVQFTRILNANWPYFLNSLCMCFFPVTPISLVPGPSQDSLKLYYFQQVLFSWILLVARDPYYNIYVSSEAQLFTQTLISSQDYLSSTCFSSVTPMSL
jgi:hypothetical protein